MIEALIRAKSSYLAASSSVARNWGFPKFNADDVEDVADTSLVPDDCGVMDKELALHC